MPKAPAGAGVKADRSDIMARERIVAARRGQRGRRRAMWLGGGVVVLAGIVMVAAFGGPGGPPSSRPLGAGLPPGAISASTRTIPVAETEAAAGRRAEIAAEEARLASLRTTRERLEAEITALRREAEERQRNMPGRKVMPEVAAGPTPPTPPTAGGGPAAAAAAPAASAPAPAETAARSLRVFVHHRANAPGGAAAAEEVAQTLRGSGIEVPTVRAAPFVPSTPVVRYFHEEDQAAAARLAGRLGRGWAIQDFRAYLPQPAPQTLEVWLPAN